MTAPKESEFAEIAIDRLLLESFPLEKSVYYKDLSDKAREEMLDKIRSRVKWHISRSLSKRQKEVLKLILRGKKESEIAEILGITRRVVNTYKHRAINKLRGLLNASSVS